MLYTIRSQHNQFKNSARWNWLYNQHGGNERDYWIEGTALPGTVATYQIAFDDP